MSWTRRTVLWAGPGGWALDHRYATRQLNHAYAVVLAAQFQGFCRDLHSESVDVVADTIGSISFAGSVNRSAIAGIVLNGLTHSRQLDRGNAHPGSLGASFDSFDLEIWSAARRLDARTARRLVRLEQLNIWRNAIAHQDFDFSRHQLEVLAGMTRLGLDQVRMFRSCCGQLAAAFDRVLARHLESIIGSPPW